MLKLPNNCRCTGTPGDDKKRTSDKLPVYPSNWDTSKADVTLIWYIKYRFYDDNLNQSKQVVIKGMNDFTTLKEKQQAVEELMQEELYEIKTKGFNKITGLYSVTTVDEISTDTPFLDALVFSFGKLKVEPLTKIDINSTLKYLSQGIKALHYDRLTLGQITKTHIAFIMEKTGEIKTRLHELKQKERIKEKKKPLRHQPWSNNTFNAYRKNFGILYSYFSDKIKIVDSNIVHSIDREKNTKKIRKTMTDEEFVVVNKFLHDNYFTFWQFMVIFYACSSRETEMLNVRKADVDLPKQRFKITVKKGQGDWEEQWRVINNDVLYLWEEVYHKATNSQYLFSESLLPGDRPIRREQVSRRWKRHVKDKLGVTADFYSLKHSHITAMMDFLLAEKEAMLEVASRTGHTTTKMISSVYDVNNANRKSRIAVKIPGRFAKSDD